MSIEGDLRAFLIADSGISALVTVGGVSRIWPGILRDNPTLPAIVYNITDENRVLTQSAMSTTASVSFQIDCWDKKSKDVRSLADLVKKRLGGYRGIFGDSVAQLIKYEGGHMQYDSETEEFRFIQDFEIWYDDA